MRILLNWLNEYLENPLSSSEFISRVESIGHEIDSCKYLGAGLENVVVGHIVEFEKHPDADKLFITKVDIGKEKLLSVVTAATNVKKDDFVPVILIGTKLPSGLEIKPVKMRGILSEGMFGSLKEFNLADSSEGVYVFKQNVTVSEPIIPLLGMDDWLFEITSTPNRGDCFSIYGMAREIALTSGIELKDILYNTPLVTSLCNTSLVPPDIQIAAQSLCHQYLGSIVNGIKIKPSPEWLTIRLYLMGCRSINNIVDITNFVLLETGQPLHAFDYNCLNEHKIIVRTASPDEKLITIDDNSINLDENMLVIADAKATQALAGIMGGKESEIKDNTSSILIEIAQFLPSSIRKTSQKVNIRTESSIRFEHGIDFEMLMPAMARALHLIKQLAEPDAISPITWEKAKDTDNYPHKIFIDFYPAKVNKLLGTNLDKDKMLKIINQIGFKTSFVIKADECYRVAVPSWRYYDVTRNADLVEEVARVIGYNSIPATIPKCHAEGSVGDDYKFKNRIRNILEGLGCQEVYTYPLCSLSDENLFKEPEHETILIENPLTTEQSQLRTSLFSSLLNVLKYNLSYNSASSSTNKENIAVFEIAPVFYYSDKEKINENWKLGVLMYGSQWQGLWAKPPALFMNDFFSIKGVMEILLNKLNINDYQLKPVNKDFLHPGRCGSIEINNKECGYIGEFAPQIAQELIKGNNKVYYFELEFDYLKQISEEKSETVHYIPIPKFPSALRDISFFIDDSINADTVLDLIKSVSTYLEYLQLIDLYKTPNVLEVKKSMAIRMFFRATDRTLTDTEIDTEMQTVKKALKGITAIIRD